MAGSSDPKAIALEADFDLAVRGLIHRMRTETGYRPTRFTQMVSELGAVGAVRGLLADTRGFQEGLMRLWELGRLDLSMERLVAYEPRFVPLFTDREREIARRRLDDLQYRESSR